MRRLQIAVLDEELPYPLTSGKRIRTFNLLRRLALRHRIHYLCRLQHNPNEQQDAEAACRRVGILPIVVPQRLPAKQGLGFAVRLVANLFSSLPYSVASHAGGDLVRAVLDLQQRERIDVWHCEWTPYAQIIRLLGERANGMRWTAMAHNVESLIWQRYTQTERRPLKRWYIRRQWRKFVAFERWVAAHAGKLIAVSDEDAALFRHDFGAESVEVVDNGVDTVFYHATPADARNPYRILFLGSLDWRPNQDAVTLLLEMIFPAVRAKEERAHLVIVGRNPPARLRQACAAVPGVELHADVADVRPFLASAGVMAVPLRIGGGSRLKILEALATGLPVISTRIGCEGLHLEAGRHLTVVEEPEAMSDSLLQALRAPRAVLLTAQRGRQRVLERYDWEPLAEKLSEVWQACAEGAAGRSARTPDEPSSCSGYPLPGVRARSSAS